MKADHVTTAVLTVATKPYRKTLSDQYLSEQKNQTLVDLSFIINFK